MYGIAERDKGCQRFKRREEKGAETDFLRPVFFPCRKCFRCLIGGCECFHMPENSFCPSERELNSERARILNHQVNLCRETACSRKIEFSEFSPSHVRPCDSRSKKSISYVNVNAVCVGANRIRPSRK